MHQFPVPASTQQFTLEIKRSRFITRIARADTAVDARELVEQCRAEWPDANHHCWAYVAGSPGDLRHADKSDDGEPKGTAGMPMLNVLSQSGIGHVAAVVTRYFGGVKLGAGGLVRAYTRCVSEALAGLETQTWLATETARVELPYALLAQVEHWLSTAKTTVTDKVFADRVTVVMEVPLIERDAFTERLLAIGQGQITIAWPDAASP
ncbi:MAG: YigZ family protein [Pseudomonadota bacterium]